MVDGTDLIYLPRYDNGPEPPSLGTRVYADARFSARTFVGQVEKVADAHSRTKLFISPFGRDFVNYRGGRKVSNRMADGVSLSSYLQLGRSRNMKAAFGEGRGF